MKEKQKEVVSESNLITILPSKDHVISQNEFFYELKKDEMIEIDKRFLEVLKTEKVINN